MITEVRLQNFKTFKDVTVKLAPGITVLVGANNSGKSSFLKALQLLAETARRGDAEAAINAAGGLLSVRRRGADDAPTLEMTMSVGGGTLDYQLVPLLDRHLGSERLRFSGSAQAEPWNGELKNGTYASGLNQVSGARPGFGLDNLRWTKLEWAARAVEFLRNLSVIDLSVPALRAPARIGRGTELGPDGERLAAVLDRLEGEAPDAWEAVQESVRLAATDVKKVLTLNADEPGTKVIGVQERSGNVFSADQMSDGLLLFIGLSTAARLSPSRSTLLALEEPDRGIHPRRLREVLDQLKVLANAGMQIVLTTHSPILLDEFRDFPENVLVFDRKGDETSVTRLSDRPEWVKELQNISLGDLWYSGILGGVPTP